MLSVRSEQHAQLSLPEFHALFEGTWQFVMACEVLCRKMIIVLRGAVVSQANAFLSAFHAARLTSSAKIVEDEKWAHVEVPLKLQNLLNLLVDSAMRDPEAFVLPRPKLDLDPPQPSVADPANNNGTNNQSIRQPLSPPSTPPSGTPPPVPPEKSTSPNAKQLYVEERAYYVVGATLRVLVVQLSDYVKLIMNLPLLTKDVVGRVIEFLKVCIAT